MLLGLGDRNMALMLGGYAFGGLMADVFAPAGRFGCTAAFVLAQAVAAISGGGSLAGALTGMYEVTAAAVIFMLLPEKLLARAAAAVMPERAADDAAPGRTARTSQRRRRSALRRGGYGFSGRRQAQPYAHVGYFAGLLGRIGHRVPALRDEDVLLGRGV
jgi:hypothetical protein